MTGQRLLVAFIALPLLYALIRYLPPSGFLALICISVLIGQYEFYRLFSMTRPARLAVGFAFGLLVVWALYQAARPQGPFEINPAALAAVSGVVIGVLLFELWFGRELTSSFKDAAILLFGVLYVAWLLGHLVLLRGGRQGIEAVFFVVLVTWVVDSAAYFAGRYLGRRPLAPQVSPKKTVEGAVGGLAGGVAAAMLAAWWFFPAIGAAESIAIGLVLGVMGQLGDLAESMLKRSAGVKDSGGLFPAHGGLLDKIDSLVFTAPTFYYYLVWFKGYGRLFL